ncbi:hypothetical protein DFJ58DRAFT_760559 [Suillus subalutaceus]|uniref:uncharacterized protein n=1 Tax=Suillus subalutaceus TaxID=48586 RepID=UPI001B872719|nr:uncharacterized protein DFJ58DRAFT_760559 [Suillus subalutaceus]KAG1872968.1 hypothetical protein DFJ58DRAFT_760559 [Suillus subalutaceus]
MNVFSAQSHRTQLILAAVSASLLTSGLFTAYNTYSRRERRRNLDRDILKSITDQDEGPKQRLRPKGDELMNEQIFRVDVDGYDEELIREQLARCYAFFGDEGMARVREKSVVVVGCGGVGSWVAVMLVRSGVSKIRLVDFDYVTLSSLNRHATAVRADVGMPKVVCIERTLKQISAWVEVDSRVEIWRKEDGGRLLEGAEWVIGMSMRSSISYCHEHHIKVFSSMGASAKTDPTRIQISDISYTMYDPLARSVRRRLRLQGVSSGIPVVYSTEVPRDVKLLPLPEEEFQKGDVKELGVFDDFRVRILPVLGSLPSLFGLHIATYVLCEMAGKPILNPLPIKNRKKLYERLLRDLLHRESKFIGEPINKLPIDEDDVALIFEDLHLGRSVVPPHVVPAHPTLLRWDPAKPLTLENCVVFESTEAAKHVRECLTPQTEEAHSRKNPRAVWGDEVQAVVERHAGDVAKYRTWVGL